VNAADEGEVEGGGSGSRNTEGVMGPRAVTSEKLTPGSQILHSKTKRVKFDRTRIVNCKLANGKKIVDHVGSNKNIGKTKRTRSSTHGGDRKTRPITNHDRRGARRMGVGQKKEYQHQAWCGTKPRVSNPVGTDWRCQPHVNEGLC